ncbi:WhiB family redox-sensing transcriptional regulator [Catenulispora sp. GP43]|uniref:WhiB family transcriptional regulator n=1 Tax=Catenulispora sp. GP43 TaxID=3156263 RepID=UPI0035122483
MTMNGSGLRPIAALWDWQESAACRGADSARFFSPSGERGFARRERERLAQELCDACPVREECARFALAVGEEHGIWGGTTSQERIAQLRRPRGGLSRVDIAAARSRETTASRAEAA